MAADDAEAVKRAVNEAAESLGGLDILVNNAGVFRSGPIEDMTLEDVDTTLKVNVRAAILASQAALTHLPEGGRIISTGGNLATRVPAGGTSPYSAVMMERMAIPRYGKPDDVAALVAFVAGPEAGSINGTGLTVDGGANA